MVQAKHCISSVANTYHRCIRLGRGRGIPPPLPEKSKFTLIRVRKPFHIINWVIMALFTNAFKSVYAHAICRAELVVKTVKRILRDNV